MRRAIYRKLFRILLTLEVLALLACQREFEIF